MKTMSLTSHTSRHILRLTIAFLSVSIISAAATAISAVATAQDLADVLGQFKSISSIHFAASVDAGLVANATCCADIEPDSVIEGTFEYWAADGKYRFNSYMDPTKYPGMDCQVAYDGQYFQLLQNSESILTFSSQDNANAVMMLPNPLLQLLQFRYPLTDANAQLRLRLKDVISDVTPAEFLNVNWVTVEEAGRVLERAEFPGGTYQGQTYVHHVLVEPGIRNKPIRIDRVSVDGTTLTSTQFAHYFRITTANGPTYWPRSVIISVSDAQGVKVGKMSFVITNFSLDGAILQEAFTISTEGVQTVWDDDLEVFIP